jgi:predicted TIM-barrel fold metal-dependent hydrolase
MNPPDGAVLPLQEYRPRSQLRVAEHLVARPRFPVIDMHNHSQWEGTWQVTDVPRLVAEMDAAGVAAMVDLDGGGGERLREHIRRFRGPFPDRFAVFATCDWVRQLQYDDFGERLARDLAEAVDEGAEGLKIWKDLGLTLKDNRGQRIAVDDPRLDPLFEAAADLHVPVLIHVADPMAFFDPLDAFNERYEELVRHPDWHFYGPEFPSFAHVQAELDARIRRHPRTTFVGAHLASLAEDLTWLAARLDAAPNLVVDLAARTAELGRQPYTARRFLTAYRDRVVFGLDSWPARREEYRVVYRLLETEDEYFPYTADPDASPGAQGRWRIYGLHLEDDVLRRIYYENALRILPRFRRLIEAWLATWPAAGRDS